MVTQTKEKEPMPESLIPASARGAGWAGHQEKMIVVSVQSGEITISKGHICSFVKGPHPGADNITKTVVWIESSRNYDARDSKIVTEHVEKFFNVRDYELLRFEEAKILTDPKLADAWFQKYCLQLTERIATALADATSETAR